MHFLWGTQKKTWGGKQHLLDPTDFFSMAKKYNTKNAENIFLFVLYKKKSNEFGTT